MERHAIVMKLKIGMVQEYKRRHDNLWPEMKELLKKSGIKNYSIWNVGEFLYQYFETEDYEGALIVLANDPIKRKWDKYMEDIIDERNAAELDEMFYFKG